jgi:hypothetical protein
MTHAATYRISLTSLHNNNNNHFKKMAVKVNANPYHAIAERAL